MTKTNFSFKRLREEAGGVAGVARRTDLFDFGEQCIAVAVDE